MLPSRLRQSRSGVGLSNKECLDTAMQPNFFFLISNRPLPQQGITPVRAVRKGAENHHRPGPRFPSCYLVQIVYVRRS